MYIHTILNSRENGQITTTYNTNDEYYKYNVE